MNLRISHTDNPALIAPILKILRNSLPDEIFHARLISALQNGYRVLIAEEANACLGYRITQDVFWGKTLYVDDLVVAEAARGHGLGASLLARAKSEAQKHSCDHIRLCSGLTRKDAHRFYEQNGFHQSSLQFVHALQPGAS